MGGKAYFDCKMMAQSRRKNDMRLTDRLYRSVEDIWMGYLQQPFVKELGDGTLDVEKFRF